MTNPSREIYLDELQSFGACEEALDHFQDKFGDHVMVNEDLAFDETSCWDIGWVAESFLSEDEYYRFLSLQDKLDNSHKLTGSYCPQWDELTARSFARLFTEPDLSLFDLYQIVNRWEEETLLGARS